MKVRQIIATIRMALFCLTLPHGSLNGITHPRHSAIGVLAAARDSCFGTRTAESRCMNCFPTLSKNEGSESHSSNRVGP